MISERARLVRWFDASVHTDDHITGCFYRMHPPPCSLVHSPAALNSRQFHSRDICCSLTNSKKMSRRGQPLYRGQAHIPKLSPVLWFHCVILSAYQWRAELTTLGLFSGLPQIPFPILLYTHWILLIYTQLQFKLS